MKKIMNLSVKGQITLPVAWRAQIGTNTICVTTGPGQLLQIAPVHTRQDPETGWVSIFQAHEKKPAVSEVIRFLQKEKKSRAGKRNKK